MWAFDSQNPDIRFKFERTVRIAAYLNNEAVSTGTGFRVGPEGKIVTCWHVLFGTDLKVFKLSEEFGDKSGQATELSEADRVDKFLRGNLHKIEIQKPDGSQTEVKLKAYDFFFDLAILEPTQPVRDEDFFKPETTALDFGDEVVFCGYPECSGYGSLESPFAVNTGVVSTFPEVEIAGGKYKNIQLNSICIGGNSGAPLFKRGSGNPIGIVNGYQWKGSEKIPVNISFATGFDLLKEKSDVFRREVLYT